MEGIFPYLDRLFLVRSSQAKMCTVPWSLDTHNSVESWLKFMLHKKKVELSNNGHNAPEN